MIEQLEEGTKGVVCLHCGMDTPVTNSLSRGPSARVFTAVRPQISLIRCTGCGKEAPYLADEIVFLRRIPNIQSYAA
jgi:hypothetical protein